MAFIDQGEFEAMKTLSGWEAARSDEYQFRAKIKVSTLAVFELGHSKSYLFLIPPVFRPHQLFSPTNSY